MARSHFKDMKRSSYFMRLKASISFGRRRGYFRALAT